MNTRLARTVVALSLLIVMVSPACSRRDTSEQALRKVNVRLDWTPWAPHAALYVADQLGYFKEEGIQVHLYVPPDPEATIKLVAAGQDDVGISYMTDLILAREQGFKVLSIGALVNHPLNCIMTLKKSGITDPKALRNKTIGTTGVASDDAYLAGVLSRNGVLPGQYKVVNIGFNLAQALKSGKVDAVVGAYWPWEGIRLEQEGISVNPPIKFQQYGVPDYNELILVTRDALVQKDPDMLKRFLRALVKGQEYVRSNPEQAVKILHSASPELSPEFLDASLKAIIPMMDFQGGEFHQTDKKWSDMVDFMLASKLIERPVPVSSLYTNALLPK